MKKTLLTVTAALTLLLFGAVGGVYASNQGWFNFTGDDNIEQADADVDEIMDILRNVNSDKITAEQALKELQDLNPSGLAKQNKELRDQVAQLTTDLNAQKEAYTSLQETNTQNVEANEQLQYELSEKSTAYDQLQQEYDGLQSVIDDLNAQVATLNYSNSEKDDYIKHLESELQRANDLAASHSGHTDKAVQEARTFQNNEE